MFGSVKLVQDKDTGTPFALKTMGKHRIVETGQEENVLNEKRVLVGVNHPFIVKLVSTSMDTHCLYMLLEFVQGGELFHLMHGRSGKAGGSVDTRFPVPQARFYAGCVVLVFEFLHARNWMYRDLKPENLLIDKDGYIKVVDFGFAKQLPPSEFTQTFLGTPEYMAPEVLARKGYNKSVDYWALGCLIYEMLCSFTPFDWEDDGAEEGSNEELYKRIAAGLFVFPDEFGKDNREAFTSDTPVEGGLGEVMSTKGVVYELLQKTIARRLGCTDAGIEDLKSHYFFKDLDWEQLYNRQISPPWVPNISDEKDLSNFDEYDPTDEEAVVLYDGQSDWCESF
jgi:serine/threonine protein kinase